MSGSFIFSIFFRPTNVYLLTLPVCVLVMMEGCKAKIIKDMMEEVMKEIVVKVVQEMMKNVMMENGG